VVCLDRISAELQSPRYNKFPGPISLLVITAALPSSNEHKKVLSKIQHLRSQPTLRLSLSLHVLHIESGNGGSPNMYLNIARLFAPSREVILFPSNLTVVPPRNAYASITSQAASASKPAIITSETPTSFMVSGNSAVLLDRDHNLWCTERFLYFNSRAYGWAECLWQVWLESLGEISFINVDDWQFEGPVPSKAVALNNVSLCTMFFFFGLTDNLGLKQGRLHHRLSNNYHSETCDLLAKQLVMMQQSTQKVHWLKQFCRREVSADQVTRSDWQNDLPFERR
jgi:hypothetical protein